MPIKPENKARYPNDWKLRSKFIINYRAKNKCEWCGVPNHAVGVRDNRGRFIGITGNTYLDLAGQGLTKQLTILPYKEAAEIRDFWKEQITDGIVTASSYIVIVLTTAHIYDMSPEACSLLNLAALCQRCHNRHDQKYRQQNRRLNENQLCLALTK